MKAASFVRTDGVYYIYVMFYYILYYSLQNYICSHIYQDFIIKTH